MNEQALMRRIRFWLALFMAGLVVSGFTAFPLLTELRWLTNAMERWPGSALYTWLATVLAAMEDTGRRYPFLAYGTDWLAFAHLTIAIAFIGAWRDPVRNKWLFTFGLVACAGVLPLALIAGAIRGIPLGWRLVDCSFGIGGAIPLWICRKTVRRIEDVHAGTCHDC